MRSWQTGATHIIKPTPSASFPTALGSTALAEPYTDTAPQNDVLEPVLPVIDSRDQQLSRGRIFLSQIEAAFVQKELVW